MGDKSLIPVVLLCVVWLVEKHVLDLLHIAVVNPDTNDVFATEELSE